MSDGWDRGQQLERLNAMERQQDVNLWTSNSIYVAASGVILVAFFTPTDLVSLRGLLPVVGFAIAVAWLVTSTRAHQYEHRWVQRARKLEDLISIPPEYRVWGRDPPPGIPAWCAEYSLLYFFGVMWICLSAAFSSPVVALAQSIILVGLTFIILMDFVPRLRGAT